MEETKPKGKKGQEVTLQEVFSGYADKATEKEPYEVSLLEKNDVVFIKDFRNIKKGHKMVGISRVAADFYLANGAIEVIRKIEGPKE